MESFLCVLVGFNHIMEKEVLALRSGRKEIHPPMMINKGY
jgi:hypothetical protein